MTHNDYYANSSVGAGAGGSHRSGGSSSHNIGQDRRGFALPAVDHHHHHPQQQQQHHHHHNHQVPFASKQSRFGNSPMVPSGGNAEAGGMYQRNRNNSVMNRWVA